MIHLLKRSEIEVFLRSNVNREDGSKLEELRIIIVSWKQVELLELTEDGEHGQEF